MITIAPLSDTRWCGADIALLYRRVQHACLPYLPDLHTPEEDRRFFEAVAVDHSLWAAADENLLGFCAFRPGWIDHLYLDPAAQRMGIGAALLAVALDGQSDVSLYTFQRNQSARHFYRKYGFAEITLSDGERNEEKEPDVLLRWVKA
jgi:putative acetyltransferase